MVKTPPKKVFWACCGGLNPFSGGTWTLRVGLFLLFPVVPVLFACPLVPKKALEHQGQVLKTYLQELVKVKSATQNASKKTT